MKNRSLPFLTLVLLVGVAFATCTKQEPDTPIQDQPISVSITVDGKTSTEAAIR